MFSNFWAVVVKTQVFLQMKVFAEETTQRCSHEKVSPPPPLMFLTDNIKMDRIPTKIKCKIHAPFILTNFYKTLLARYLVLIPDSPNSVTKFYLQIADKKLRYNNSFSIIVPCSEGLGCFDKLTWWPEPRALVKKIEHLCYPTIFVAVRWTVFSKLSFQSCKYQ